jgi:ATP phosphoribosyltransferase
MKQIGIVIPDGSMQGVITNLIEKATGLPVVVEKNRTKEGKIEVKWIKCIVFQRPQEIPDHLKNGHFDVAIVGEDWIANWGYEFPVLLKLPIGRAGNKPVKIVLAVDQASDFQSVEELTIGCEVATEYVKLAERFFSSKGRCDIRVVQSFGNTEHKIRFGATAIIDITEKGDSLKENQLRVLCEIMESNTAVVANINSYADEEKRFYMDCFVRLIKGAYQASQSVLVVANVPELLLEAASKIFGGLKGPSYQPIYGRKGWFAMQSIVPRNDERDIIFELLKIGVVDVFVNRDLPLIMS